MLFRVAIDIHSDVQRRYRLNLTDSIGSVFIIDLVWALIVVAFLFDGTIEFQIFWFDHAGIRLIGWRSPIDDSVYFKDKTLVHRKQKTQIKLFLALCFSRSV